MSEIVGAADYEQKIRAYELVTRKQNPLSIRGAADELGYSKSTVQRWVREIQQAEEYIDLLDVAEVRVGQAFRLAEYVGLLRHRIDKEGRPVEQIMPVLLNVEKFIADLHGTRMPARMQIEQTGPVSPMDPRLIAAIRDAKRFVGDEREEIDGRGDDDA